MSCSSPASPVLLHVPFGLWCFPVVVHYTVLLGRLVFFIHSTWPSQFPSPASYLRRYSVYVHSFWQLSVTYTVWPVCLQDVSQTPSFKCSRFHLTFPVVPPWLSPTRYSRPYIAHIHSLFIDCGISLYGCSQSLYRIPGPECHQEHDCHGDIDLFMTSLKKQELGAQMLGSGPY